MAKNTLLSGMSNANPGIDAMAGLQAQIVDLQKKGIKELQISELVRRDPFAKVFPIGATILDSIESEMRSTGFDRTQPVIVWETEEGYLLIDGFTRTKAAEAAGLKSVFAIVLPDDYFKSEPDAIEYMIRLQFHRRSVSDDMLLAAAENFQPNKTRGEGREAEQFARRYGIGRATANRVLAVAKRAEENDKSEIRAGTATINQIYNQLRDAEEPTRKAKSAPEPILPPAPATTQNFSEPHEQITRPNPVPKSIPEASKAKPSVPISPASKDTGLLNPLGGFKPEISEPTSDEGFAEVSIDIDEEFDTPEEQGLKTPAEPISEEEAFPQLDNIDTPLNIEYPMPYVLDIVRDLIHLRNLIQKASEAGEIREQERSGLAEVAREIVSMLL